MLFKYGDRVAFLFLFNVDNPKMGDPSSCILSYCWQVLSKMLIYQTREEIGLKAARTGAIFIEFIQLSNIGRP